MDAGRVFRLAGVAVVRTVIVDGHFAVIRWLNLVGFLGDSGRCLRRTTVRKAGVLVDTL